MKLQTHGDVASTYREATCLRCSRIEARDNADCASRSTAIDKSHRIRTFQQRTLPSFAQQLSCDSLTLHHRLHSKASKSFADEPSAVWNSWSCGSSARISCWNWNDRETVYLSRCRDPGVRSSRRLSKIILRLPTFIVFGVLLAGQSRVYIERMGRISTMPLDPKGRT